MVLYEAHYCAFGPDRCRLLVRLKGKLEFGTLSRTVNF